MITSAFPGIPAGLDRSSVERIVREIVLRGRGAPPSQIAAEAAKAVVTGQAHARSEPKLVVSISARTAVNGRDSTLASTGAAGSATPTPVPPAISTSRSRSSRANSWAAATLGFRCLVDRPSTRASFTTSAS